MSAIAKFILSFFLEKLWGAALEYFKGKAKEVKQDKEDTKSEEKYNEVVDKGDSISREDRKKSTDDFLNSGG